MKTLKYKGYVGSIEFSPEDNLLFGEILGIDGLVNYEGTTMQELTDSFHEAVEDYLAFCKDHNWTPQKSYSGAFNVRVSPATHRDIANRASEAGISINAFVKKALDEAVKEPASVMTQMVDGYKPKEMGVATLNEPAVSYGSRDIAELGIPPKDIPLAKIIAGRMGWDFLVHYPESGLERALNEIRSGAVTEYGSFDEMMKEIGEEDGEV